MRGGLGEYDGVASAGRHGDQGRVILRDIPPSRDGPGEIRLPVQRGALKLEFSSVRCGTQGVPGGACIGHSQGDTVISIENDGNDSKITV